MPRHIFDVTALRQYMARQSQFSGIQRVSVMTIDRARKKIGANHVWLGYHDRRSDRYKLCPCPADAATDLTDHATLRALLGIRAAPPALPTMEKYTSRGMKQGYHLVQRDLRAALGENRYFRYRGLTRADWIAARRARRRRAGHMDPARDLDSIARPGDRLVLLDNAWHPRGLEPWLEYAGTRLGLEVCVLLHDLIPLVTPQYTEGDSPARFRDWLVRSTGYVTRYLANSENTGRDLRAFLATLGARQPISVVPLAQAPLPSPARDTDPALVPASTPSPRCPITSGRWPRRPTC